MAQTGLASSIKRVVALSLATVLLSAVPAFAVRAPVTSDSEISVTQDAQTQEFRKKLSAQQKKLDEFNAQLDKLDRELEIASEEYNGAVDQLGQMQTAVETAESDLSNAQESVALQNQLLGKRAASMYKDGGSLATVEVLLEAKSVADFISRVKFLNTIGMHDADIAESLRAQQTQLEQQVTDLRNSRAAAKSLEFELKARQIDVLLRIQEREALLQEAKAEFADLLMSEAARRESAQNALLAEILTGANAKGIVVQQGSPVETALAYHGVPYVWGGESVSGFDCSGLVLYVFKQHGVSLPHYSGSQFQLGQKVASGSMVAGDVVFFGSPIHHVGIYMGGGYYIHAPRTGDFVKISKLADRSDFAGARRYDWQYRTEPIKNAQKSTSAALSGVR